MAETKHGMAGNACNPAATDILLDSTPMTFQIISPIGRLEPVNGIAISRKTHIPKGRVSKITHRRVIRKKLLHDLARASSLES